ncbi:MAG: SelT/SelW/SelH family protein [Gemmataceae bacterium]|nr:SelT/SelW/SelH family protein [Gemmataceae bacterium]
MVAAIRKTHGEAVTTETHMGSGGVFDVVIDGNKVFSKFDAGRFPSNSEILAFIDDKGK